MALKDLQKILQQVHEPDEYQLVAHDHESCHYWDMET